MSVVAVVVVVVLDLVVAFVGHVVLVVVVVVVVVVRGTPSQEFQLPKIQGHRRRIPAERGQGGPIATEYGCSVPPGGRAFAQKMVEGLRPHAAAGAIRRTILPYLVSVVREEKEVTASQLG